MPFEAWRRLLRCQSMLILRGRFDPQHQLPSLPDYPFLLSKKRREPADLQLFSAMSPKLWGSLILRSLAGILQRPEFHG